MAQSIKIVAIIPARGGSKGVPRKNIRQVAGRPLITWSILCAKASSVLDRIIVSTDDEEIAQVAKKAGAEVPFMRPASLATDTSSGMAPMEHALQWLQKHEGYEPDWLMCLQPTSPLRTPQDIDGAVELAREKNALSVVSVTEAKDHPLWCKRMDEEGRLESFQKASPAVTRRQDLPKVWALNGAIYLAHRQMILDEKTWYGPRTYGFEMPKERSLDIDSWWDLHLADLILRDRKL